MKRDVIRSKREQKGYTQEELAELVGCTRQTINLIEVGKYSNPTIKLCVNISNALESDLNTLFGN